MSTDEKPKHWTEWIAALPRKLRNRIERRWIDYIVASRSNKVLVIGDSHALTFRRREVIKGLRGYGFVVREVGGATASGLANPNSTTRAYEQFHVALDDFDGSTVIVILGEVDTGFVIWYRAQKYGESVESMLEKAIRTYSEFLKDVQSRVSRLIVVSAPLPTINDMDRKGEVANLRAAVKATKRERTDLTHAFNDMVKVFCDGNGIAFADLTTPALGDDGLVDNKWLNSNPLDHHYNQRVYANALVDVIGRILDSQKAT